MSPKQQRPQPVVPLRNVLRLVSDGRYRVTERAYQSANFNFGWDDADIKRALLKLRSTHFDKPEARYTKPFKDMDVYKPRKLMDGYDVYIHLYLDSDGAIVVDSFKPLE